MRKLKTGLVGCGKVAHLHAAALQSLPESDFVAVCGRTAAKAGPFAEKYRVAAYTDLEEMIARSRVEALCICTPHPEHAAPVITATRAGVHVLVEKPLASSLADCDAMLAAARAGKAQVGTISQRRFYAPARRIRQAIDSGRLGKPVLGTATMFNWRGEEYYRSDPWRGSWEKEGGGVLVNQAPHQLDVLQWLMGSEMETLYGVWQNINH